MICMYVCMLKLLWLLLVSLVVIQKLILLRSGRVEILISDQVQKLKGNRQQADPEQITHRGQIWNRRVVGIDLSLPHPMDHYVGDVEESCDLQHRCTEVNEDEERSHRCVTVFHVIDQVNENNVARYHHCHQNSRGSSVHTWRNEAIKDHEKSWLLKKKNTKEDTFPKKIGNWSDEDDGVGVTRWN